MRDLKHRADEPTISLLGTQLGCTTILYVGVLVYGLWNVGEFGKFGAAGVVIWVLFGTRVLNGIANSKPAIGYRARRAAAAEARRSAAWRATPCKHGTAGGLTANACSACVEERQRFAYAQSERQRHEDLRRKSQALEHAEVRRLAKERRRRVHSLLQLSPRQFERAVAELYEARGFQVTLTPSSNDEGRDVIAEKDNQTLYIECKRYAALNLVGRPALQKLVGAIPDGRIGAVFITTSGFSAPAIKYAEERGVALIDGLHLDAMLRETFPNSGQVETVKVTCLECGIPVQFRLSEVGTVQTCPHHHRVSNVFDPQKIDEWLNRKTTQMCDRCGSDMVLRNGPNGKFWGCAEYPDCRFTKPLRGTTHKV